MRDESKSFSFLGTQAAVFGAVREELGGEQDRILPCFMQCNHERRNAGDTWANLTQIQFPLTSGKTLGPCHAISLFL